ncbi:MAG: hypothetical protein PVF05_12170 [Gemmatimonadales bacterium]|jgi:hypothetical protein
MQPSRIARFPLLLALVGLVAALPACSGSDNNDNGTGTGPSSDPAYVGVWNATSFSAFGMDAIDLGMELQAEFSTSTYLLTVTNDQVGICDAAGTSDCTSSGDLSGTSSQVTFDPGTADAVAFDYTVSGTTMTFTGSIDGAPVSIVFAKVP